MIRAGSREPASRSTWPSMPLAAVEAVAANFDVPVGRFEDAACCVAVLGGLPVKFTTEVS